MKKIITTVLIVFLASLFFNLQAEDKEKSGSYNPVPTVMHHISDANEFHVYGDIHLPLPCILYDFENGFNFFLSSAFHYGADAVDGYVLNHGRVNKITTEGFNAQGAELKLLHTDSHGHKHYVEHEKKDGKEVSYVIINEQKHYLEKPYTLTGPTSFIDFSITKNVFGMLMASIVLFWIFGSAGSLAKKREGQAPTGMQSFIEPFFLFIRDEVAKPMIGDKHYERFLPFIMTIFFFILMLNLLGLVPFFPGSANVTGNIGVTMALAIITLLVTVSNGNKHYWEHILWMPGIPAWVKLILTPIELLGAILIKPFSLMIRLFANITAGHIIILSLVSLIFVFGNAGESVGGSVGGMVVAIPFTLFMNVIEIIVAFIQAYIFAILTASYIGEAVAEGHHDDHGHEHAH